MGSKTLLKAIHLPESTPPADWSKLTVVWLPTLKVCQLRRAWEAVWVMLTLLPEAVGALAPSQFWKSSFV